MWSVAHCRLCPSLVSDYYGVRYGVRHSAHIECYVKRHGWARMIETLPDWKVNHAVRYAARMALATGQFGVPLRAVPR